MFDGIQPESIDKYGGLIASVPPSQLGPDLSPDCQNVAFTAMAVQPRPGHSLAFTIPGNKKINGLGGYNNLTSGTQYPIAFDEDGNLWIESPAGSGVVRKVTSSQVTPPAGALMNMDVAYGRAYLAFGDGKFGTGAPASFDGTNLDPVSLADPFGGNVLPPNSLVATLDTTAGAVANGTYYIVVTAIDPDTGHESGPCAEVSVVVTQVGGNAQVLMDWAVSVGASSYRIYVGTAAGSENQYFTSTSASYTWTGSSGTAGTPPAASLQVKQSATAGNVCGTTRYGVLFYKMRSGSYSLASKVFSFDPAAGYEIEVTGVPTGPANVTGRLFAFTIAGGSSGGPFFAIESTQYVDGVEETTTLIGDNASTTATFNFDDTFLANATDMTDYLRVIEIPNSVACRYLKSVDCFAWWGDSSAPSAVWISGPGDAAYLLGDTGAIQPSPNDGKRVTNVYEVNGRIVVAKEDDLYLVSPQSGDPATWGFLEATRQPGCCGPRATAVSGTLAVFVHRFGVYTFDGSSTDLVSEELCRESEDRPGWWERINWSYAHLIWIVLDADRKEAHIGVPLDDSTVCSHILRCNYYLGWKQSWEYSPWVGRYRFVPGRRWSIDTIAASQGVIISRPGTLGQFPGDRRIAVEQLLLSDAAASGNVMYQDPGNFTDMGQAIDAFYQAGYIWAGHAMNQPPAGFSLLEGFQLKARGAGKANFTVATQGDIQQSGALALPPGEPMPITQTMMMLGNTFSLRISSAAHGGFWQMRAAYFYMRPFRSVVPFAGGQP